jgi:hypothetical protein
MCPLERFVHLEQTTNNSETKGAGDTWCRFEVSSLGGVLIVGTSRCLPILLLPTAAPVTVTPFPALKA